MFSKISCIAFAALLGLAFIGCGEMAPQEEQESSFEGGKADMIGGSLVVVEQSMNGKIVTSGTFTS